VKKILVFLSLLLLFSGLHLARGAEKKILLVVAPANYQDLELFIPYKILSEAGFKPVIASTVAGQELRGVQGSRVTSQLKLSQAKINDYRGLIFIGGPGANVFWNDPGAHRLINEALRRKMVLGAICIGPVTLARAGALKGKRATVWSDYAGGKPLNTKKGMFLALRFSAVSFKPLSIKS